MAAQITGSALASSGVLGVIYDTAKYPLSMIVGGVDSLGGYAEYVFLGGVASTVVGSAVLFDELGVSALTNSGAVGTSTGFLAVALTINVAATTYAWYAVSGAHNVSLAASVADNASLYTSTGDGVLDDAKIADKQISGIMSRASTTGAAVVRCQLNRPFAGFLMS